MTKLVNLSLPNNSSMESPFINFKNHCLKWPSKDILLYIERLLETEFMCKTQSSLNREICEKNVLSIAKKGEIFFN